MRGILIDVNIEGHGRIISRLLNSNYWEEVWNSLNLSIYSFRDVGLANDCPDKDVWRVCQEQGLALLTANRNDDGEESLESTIERENQSTSLPVFTVANAERLRRERAHADAVVERLLQYLLEIEEVLGTGRMFLP